MTATDLKYKFITDLLSDQTLTELVDANHEFSNPAKMVNNRLFTWWQFKNDVLQKAKVLIGLKIDFPRVTKNFVNKEFQLGVLVLCHKGLMEVENKAGNRIDLIGDELERLWTWDRSGTDFRLQLVSNLEDSFNEDYYCRTVWFKSATSNNYVNGVRQNA